MTTKLHLPKDYKPVPLAGIVVYGTTFLLVGLEVLVLLYGFIAHQILHPLFFIGLVAIVYMAVASWYVHKKIGLVGNWMTLVFYLSVATGVLLGAGINAPVGLLMLGFFIFLTGTIVGVRFIISSTIAAVIVIIATQTIHRLHLIEPNLTALSLPPHLGDVLTYIGLFGIFGLLSWVVSRHIHQMLYRAQEAEARLRLQNDTIALQLEEESKKLKQAQMEEIRQLYHFAQIGQSTIAILHELSNHLSVLALDIDDLADRQEHAATVKNTKESVHHIHLLIREARQRIHDRRRTEVFDALAVVRHTVNDLTPLITSSGIGLVNHYPSKKRVRILGDPLSLAHVVTILIKNARDACASVSEAKITIGASITNTHLHIDVMDNGPGIPETVRQHLFQPKQSTKRGGMGVGLYITKQILETQFHGDISLDESEGTRFIIRIPVMEKKA